MLYLCVHRSLKRVVSLRIYMDESDGVEPHLVFDMQCEVGVLKRHHFQLQECEVIQALFDREGVCACVHVTKNRPTNQIITPFFSRSVFPFRHCQVQAF